MDKEFLWIVFRKIRFNGFKVDLYGLFYKYVIRVKKFSFLIIEKLRLFGFRFWLILDYYDDDRILV